MFVSTLQELPHDLSVTLPMEYVARFGIQVKVFAVTDADTYLLHSLVSNQFSERELNAMGFVGEPEVFVVHGLPSRLSVLRFNQPINSYNESLIIIDLDEGRLITMEASQVSYTCLRITAAALIKNIECQRMMVSFQRFADNRADAPNAPLQAESLLSMTDHIPSRVMSFK